MVAEGKLNRFTCGLIMEDSKDVEKEVFQAVDELEAKKLESVCQHLQLEIGSRQGNKSSLQKLILRHLSSEELEEQEAQGSTIFLELLVYIRELRYQGFIKEGISKEAERKLQFNPYAEPFESKADRGKEKEQEEEDKF